MKKVVVIGGQGHAKVCISMLKKLSEFCVLGYTALEASDEILGVPFLGGDDVLERIKKENPDCGAVIGVGSVKISSN
ncbi:MAG: hexapeptide transferase, partial [Candidatus Omnitrophica bacterium]|nr:hexapeptide transferase [Candidatus Omnitrophota bacterium]